MKNVHIIEYTTKSGKKYGYRFEIAKVSSKRQWVIKKDFRTKTEAMKAGREALHQYETTGVIYAPSDMSYADFLDYWLEHDCGVDLKANTVTDYRKKINNYIKPDLGKYYLKTLTRDTLQKFITDMYDRGFARNTLTVIKGILTKSLNYAADHKYIVNSPAVRLKIPRGRMPNTPTRSDPHIFIPEDKMAEIFARFPENKYPANKVSDSKAPVHIPLKLGYECGLRLGEAFGLCWEDIDFEKKTLTVNRQVQWYADPQRSDADKEKSNGSSECGDGYWYFTTPKYNSYRTIEISDALAALLLREKERQEKAMDYYDDQYIYYYAKYPLKYDGTQPAAPITVNPIGTRGASPIHLICVRDCGSYISPRIMQHASTVIKKAICQDFDFHSLRHTHASMLEESGAQLKYIQKRLGHAKAAVTVNVYEHLTETMRERGREKLNEMFKATPHNS